MRAAEAAIAEGRPIMIFPEGTRVPPGETPPLQPGFAGLYRVLKLPVVPVAVDSGRLAPRKALRQARGHRHLPLRRPDPGRPQARRDRGAGPCGDQRAGRERPWLGLIEGFFGRPWSWAERREAVRFLRPHGYSFYFYAPKADPWLRRRWQEPHPEAELAELAAFARRLPRGRRALRHRAQPVRAALPRRRGWQETLAAKLAMLAPLKPDDLAILFDDMRGDVPELAARQAAIVHFAAERGVAARILCCPSYYSDDPILDVAFGQRPPFYLEQLGRALDPAIQLFWTGEEVCSREYTPGHLARVAGQMGRKPVLWDNYPVNDGARMSQHLHLRGFTGRPAAIAGQIAGHAINPASQPLLSRIPLLTLAESYAKGEAYDYLAAFDRAAREVLGEELAARVGRTSHAAGPRARPARRAQGGAEGPLRRLRSSGGARDLALAGRLLERQRRTGADAIIRVKQI